MPVLVYKIKEVQFLFVDTRRQTMKNKKYAGTPVII
jgi:hypothetical protein